MSYQPNTSSTGSKAEHANALPPKKRVAPGAPRVTERPSPAMATLKLAEAEEAEAAAVKEEKIAACRAALGERMRKLAAERMSAVESTPAADALRSGGSLPRCQGRGSTR